MSRQRRAKWGALLSVAAIAMAASSIGVTQGSFASQTNEAANLITAMPDFRGPTVSSVAIGKNPVGAIGFIRSSANYRVYANVTDLGTPPSGTATVLANVSSVTTGEVALALTAGSFTVGGQTFNYRSATRTSNAGLPAGPLAFTVTATDVATNFTTANGSVTIDNTAPAATNISASGGIAGRPEVGDVLTLTTNDTLDTFLLLANWTGAATTVEVRFRNNAANDRLEIWDVGQNNRVPFGTISLGRTDFTTSNLWFQGSTMTQAGSVITVVLGGPITGTVTTVGGTGTMVWTPAAAADDRAGNAMSTAALNEPAPLDRDF